MRNAQRLARKFVVLQLTDPYVHKLVVEVLVEFGRRIIKTSRGFFGLIFMVYFYITMKRDQAHTVWRDMNWVSCDGTVVSAIEIAPRIIEILQELYPHDAGVEVT